MRPSDLQHRRTIRIGSWFCVLFLAFLSLLPSNLEIRTGAPDELEHFLAYFVAAVLFGLSYTRKPLLVAVALVSISVLLEALQAFSPGRSVRLHDVWFSGAGAISGVVAASIVVRWRFRLLCSKQISSRP
ncbi:VanZ family protein [Microvirga soli]|uniref:VanZ family protein n=1 Tax=Microvirga soli TaxID=1854496 RepID=UPI00191E933B